MAKRPRGNSSNERLAALEQGLQETRVSLERLTEQVGRLALSPPMGENSRTTPATLGASGDESIPREAPLLPGTKSLAQFLREVDDLTGPERLQIAEAAMRMLEGLFVHLPLKRAMHGIDPVQRIKLLRRRLEKEQQAARPPSSARAFHAEMIEIFHSLRDLHTNYVLPFGYQGWTAFLPFLVQEYVERHPADGASRARFLVTRLAPGFNHPAFQRGVQVVSWNGIEIERAVEIAAAREAGSNEDARHARGLESLTLRSLALGAPPDEEWVIVGYESQGVRRELKFPWMVSSSPSFGAVVDSDEEAVLASDDQAAEVLGYDGGLLALARARKAIFFPELIRVEEEIAARLEGWEPNNVGAAVSADDDFFREKFAQRATAAPRRTLEQAAGRVHDGVRRARRPSPRYANVRDAGVRLSAAADSVVRAAVAAATDVTELAMSTSTSATTPSAAAQESSLLPEFFAYRTLEIDGRKIGYIRIYSFMTSDANSFVAEFVRMAQRLPPEALLIDVRGNGGGNINAGEMLLQVLTPREIEPERFHFINSRETLLLCQKRPALAPWIDSIDLAIETAEVYSQGFPLTRREDANADLWKYPGKTALLIDALCYSTTDIFAAGFQDHEIGPIIGVHSRTGAGGANVWTYDLFKNVLQFPSLPKGATFRTALRRATRVGKHVGVPLEDLGVVANEVHQLTRDDLLKGNVDLFRFAAGKLT